MLHAHSSAWLAPPNIVSRDDLNASLDVVRRSHFGKNCTRLVIKSDECRPGVMQAFASGCASRARIAPVLRSRSVPITTKLEFGEALGLEPCLGSAAFIA